MDADRRRDIGQVVLEPRRDDLVVPARHLRREAVEGVAAHAVQAHRPHARRHLGVAGHDHAAFAGRDRLVGVEAEHRRVGVERADQAAAAGRRQRMRRVLDHAQAAAPGDGEDRRHVGRQAAVVDRDHRLGLGRDRMLDLVRVDVERRRIDVDQLDVGAEVANDLGSGGEGVRRRDHLVARADAAGFERQVQPRRRRVDGERLQRGVAEKRAEVVLEALGLRAGRDPARAQRVDDLGDLGLADVGQRERKERWLAHGFAASRPSTTRCFALAPATALRSIAWSSVTRRPPFATASASR